MKANPYAGSQVVLSNGAPVTDFRMPGSQERLLSTSTGEFNANDKKELIRAISGMFSAMERGDLRHQSVSAEQQMADAQARREVMLAAAADPPGPRGGPPRLGPARAGGERCAARA